MNNRMEAILATVEHAAANKGVEGAVLPFLFVLTIVTGLVDAVSYLALGHVFVANMTGNVVFLGFAIAGDQEFSIAASLMAIAAFMTGALAGGRLGVALADRRQQFLAVAIVGKVALVGTACAVAMIFAGTDHLRYALIVLLALPMGLQNATARVLAIPDLTTTVLTLTLTGLAADSKLAGGTSPRVTRRLLAAGAMFVGAAIGAFGVIHYGVAAVLILTFLLLASNAVGAFAVWRRSLREPSAPA